MFKNKKYDSFIGGVLTFFFLIQSITIHSQNHTLLGTVKDDQNNPVSEVVIFTKDSIFTVSDGDGNFMLSNLPKKSVTLYFKSLEFSDLDTLVYFKKEKELVLDIVLRRKFYDLGEVIVSTPKENLFDKENWTILDYLTNDSLIFVLSLENPKRYLNRYSSSGNFIDRLFLNRF